MPKFIQKSTAKIGEIGEKYADRKDEKYDNNLNSNLIKQAEANGFCSNAILIGDTYNLPLLVSNTTINMPPDCAFGVRSTGAIPTIY